MKRYIAFLSLTLLVFLSCKKNDPMSELGSSNNEFASQLRVTYNTTKPAFGDTLTITASTWQRDDKFQKLTIFETLVENVGLQLLLKNGSALVTKTADEATLVLVDTIAKKRPALEVLASNLDAYWVTTSNNYVIRHSYKVVRETGKYPDDATLINAMNDVEFNVLKGLLAYTITRSDYLVFFPTAPASHFTTSGAYVLTATGMANLKANLSRAALVANVNTIKKLGNYSLTVDVNSITPTNTITAATRTFDITIQ